MHIKAKYLLHVFLFGFLFSKEPSINEGTFYNLSAVGIEGDTIRMDQFRGKKVLLVNVASRCGFTPQYNNLQYLHEQYNNRVVILGFPSNDFLWQEPGTNSEIKKFCQLNYGVTFQMFEKIHVKGRKQHPIYNWLTDSNLNGWNEVAPSWNFFKYLINEKGRLIKYYKSGVDPTDTLITRYLEIDNDIVPSEN